MKYVIPNNITLLTMNATDSESEWVSGTTYSYGDVVVVDADMKKYKCAADTSLGEIPSENTTVWIPTSMNKYALIDSYTNSQTENADSIDFTFNATNIDTISFFNVEATEVYVKIEDSSGVIIYETTTSMIFDDLQGFGDYLFSEQELTNALTGNVSPENLNLIIASMSENDLVDRMTLNPPVYYDTTVTVSIRNNGSIAKCGNIIIGRKRDLGVTLWGASIQNLSTAKKERDADWGTVNLVQGLPYKIIDIPVVLSVELADIVQRRLEKIDGIPCLFLADDTEAIQFNSLNIFGFFNDFELPITITQTEYTLRVESLI